MNTSEIINQELLAEIDQELSVNEKEQNDYKHILNRMKTTTEDYLKAWKNLGILSLVNVYLSTLKHYVETGIKNAENYLRFTTYQLHDYGISETKEPLIHEAQKIVFEKFNQYLNKYFE